MENIKSSKSEILLNNDIPSIMEKNIISKRNDIIIIIIILLLLLLLLLL
jgi:hypothetical protein